MIDYWGQFGRVRVFVLITSGAVFLMLSALTDTELFINHAPLIQIEHESPPSRVVPQFPVNPPVVAATATVTASGTVYDLAYDVPSLKLT